jgi:hypothetical protein
MIVIKFDLAHKEKERKNKTDATITNRYEWHNITPTSNKLENGKKNVHGGGSLLLNIQFFIAFHGVVERCRA